MNTQFCLTPPWRQQMLQPQEKLTDLHSKYLAGFVPSKKKKKLKIQNLSLTNN